MKFNNNSNHAKANLLDTFCGEGYTEGLIEERKKDGLAAAQDRLLDMLYGEGATEEFDRQVLEKIAKLEIERKERSKKFIMPLVREFGDGFECAIEGLWTADCMVYTTDIRVLYKDKENFDVLRLQQDLDHFSRTMNTMTRVLVAMIHNDYDHGATDHPFSLLTLEFTEGDEESAIITFNTVIEALRQYLVLEVGDISYQEYPEVEITNQSIEYVDLNKNLIS